METVSRKPFQGIANIVRFNWHFYALAIAMLLGLLGLKMIVAPAWQPFIQFVGLLLLVATMVSLAASFYVYDASGFYRFHWLNLSLPPNANIVNIHAGFDETSALLHQKFPEAALAVFDFYDAEKHTEVSIRRARKAYPAYPGTKGINTTQIPLTNASVDAVFCILSAHEIRNREERVRFFQQLQVALKTEGRMVVVEHLRNLPNFLAYNFGFFHFHSAATWQRTFSNAGLSIERQQSITPFITAYYLQKNGNAA